MISIIGSGKVGSAIAFLCGSLGLDDVVLINRTEKKAIGEALDISNTIPAASNISISGTNQYSKMSGSDVVVVTASSGMQVKNRTEKMFDQAILVRMIAKEIAKYAPQAKILMVTNPVDVLTYVVQKEGNLPSQNVVGVASNLDSSRFRYVLSQELGVNQSQITGAIVLGEHDDSMVPIFSCTKVNGRPISEVLDEQKKIKITTEVRNYWKYLRDYKGHSVFGIAKNTFDIIKCIITNEPLDVAASTLLSGQYDVSDICMGVPLTINKSGVTHIQQIKITQDEEISLRKSASIVKNNIAKTMEFLKTMQ